jgi:hypothetical protein
VCNIGGEELWWRGYVLPRQELAFGGAAWIVHGLFWSAFHLFMQPTLWDPTRMAIGGMALSFVAQRTKNAWPGIVGHSFGNLPFFLSLAKGVISRRRDRRAFCPPDQSRQHFAPVAHSVWVVERFPSAGDAERSAQPVGAGKQPTEFGAPEVRHTS